MTNDQMTKIRLLRALALGGTLLGLACVLVGCGPGKSDVVGKVRYQGKELTFGNVQIEGTGGIMVGTIQSDGSYTVKNVQAGKARVAVSAVDDKYAEKMKELAGAAKEGMKQGKPKISPVNVEMADYSKIPLSYSDFGKSNLSVDVKGGGITNYDIEIK
ncbi:MAG: hypothetical protein ACJ8F7_22540 [Gemmataceae bacterium]